MKTGLHFIDKYDLNKPNWYGVGCECRTSKTTATGYIHIRRTNYISEYKTVITVNHDGTAKAVTKVKGNYFSPYQFTSYFNEYGLEILDLDRSTRAELAEYKRIRERCKQKNGMSKER